jgi:phosphate/sulfate permease
MRIETHSSHYDSGVTSSSVRTYSAVAGIPAALVVVAHLALVWGDSHGIEAHRRLAFNHGIALAAVLAAVLICSRIALHLETGSGAPAADSVAIVGAVIVLAHLARVWRDGSNPLHRFGLTAEHIAAMTAVALTALAIARYETGRRSERSSPAASRER